MKKRFFLSAVACSALWACGPAAMAQAGAFPQRPITLVVPFAPGGTVDLVARVVAEGWAKKLGQPVIVDNRAGAATILAADYVQKAAPDGYTVLIGTSTTFVVNPIIYPRIPYNPLTSFDPIGVVGSTGLALLVNSGAKPRTVQELIADIKGHGKDYAYASHGNGSTVHFAAEMLWTRAQLTGVVTHVPYKGSAPALTDLAGGQVPVAFDAIPAAAAAAKGDRVRILAVTSEQRSVLLPGVPTIAESGYPGFKMTSWFGIVGPRNMPADVRLKLEQTLAETLSSSQLAGRLESSGFDARWTPAAGYADLVKADTAALTPIAKAASISASN